MFLHSISINNVSCFTSELSEQTKRMEFDTDDLTSNVNILIGPNNSWKTQFLAVINFLAHFYDSTFSPPYSLYPQKQTISSVRKTNNSDKKLIVWLPDFLDIDFDIFTRTAHSYHTKIANSQIKLLIENQTIIYHADYQWNISDKILHQCESELWPNYLNQTSNSSWISHIKEILRQCTICQSWWIVLVDEPETHLHPQLQQKIWKILSGISKEFHIQFFISTHSPIFINETNCINVYRFYQTSNGNTRHNPWGFIWNESTLQQILTQNNMSKIFFSKKIVMCEWEIDQIFLKRFLEYYLQKRWIKPYQIECDFLPIAWKWSYHMRAGFCKRWKIDAVFIWDRDNIFESNFWFEITHEKESYNLFIKWTKLSKSAWYNGLIKRIKDKNILLFDKIENQIINNYHNWLFLLPSWDIESYMWVSSKWIETTLDFCKHSFDTRIHNKNFQKKHDELMHIFDQIININT